MHGLLGRDIDHQKAMELTFVLQTLVQILFPIVENLKNDTDLNWKLDCLQHFQQIIEKYSKERI